MDQRTHKAISCELSDYAFNLKLSVLPITAPNISTIVKCIEYLLPYIFEHLKYFFLTQFTGGLSHSYLFLEIEHRFR